MVEIGGKPILWHIMKIYSHYEINDFIICLGYKGYLIKEYFVNYYLHASNVTVDLEKNAVQFLESRSEPWRITLVDTGDETQTGGRLAAIRGYLEPNEPFCFTYGDGVADIDIKALVSFHRAHGKTCTVTAVQPPGRFGALRMAGDLVGSFQEKPIGDGGYINGGFFVASAAALDHVEGPATMWEQGPMRALATAGELVGYKHDGFWQAMDTLRDKHQLEELWQSGRAPWKVW
jgi:glucose-1-phosphate cytidylyltransferase